MSFNSNYIVLHCVISHSTMIFSKLVFSFSSLSNKAHLLTQPLTPFLGRGSMGPRPETWQGDTRFTPVLPSAVSKILRHYCKNEIVFKTTNIPTFQTTFINHAEMLSPTPFSKKQKQNKNQKTTLLSLLWFQKLHTFVFICIYSTAVEKWWFITFSFLLYCAVNDLADFWIFLFIFFTTILVTPP